MRYKGEHFEASHPPIVSKALFDQVQDVLTQRSKPQVHGKVFHAFVGLLRCEECGCMVTAEIQKGHTYYHCTKKRGPCTQRYIRQEALLTQVKEAIIKVYIDQETKEQMLRQWDIQAKEASNASSTRARQVQVEMKACDERMERLLDLYIARDIGPEEYQRKKAKLLAEKVQLKEKLREIERGSGGWLELARTFLNTCHEAGSIALQENTRALKAFLKNIGSNFVLKNRTLCLTYTSPYSVVAEKDPNKKIRE